MMIKIDERRLYFQVFCPIQCVSRIWFNFYSSFLGSDNFLSETPVCLKKGIFISWLKRGSKIWSLETWLAILFIFTTYFLNSTCTRVYIYLSIHSSYFTVNFELFNFYFFISKSCWKLVFMANLWFQWWFFFLVNIKCIVFL